MAGFDGPSTDDLKRRVAMSRAAGATTKDWTVREDKRKRTRVKHVRVQHRDGILHAIFRSPDIKPRTVKLRTSDKDTIEVAPTVLTPREYNALKKSGQPLVGKRSLGGFFQRPTEFLQTFWPEDVVAKKIKKLEEKLDSPQARNSKKTRELIEADIENLQNQLDNAGAFITRHRIRIRKNNLKHALQRAESLVERRRAKIDRDAEHDYMETDHERGYRRRADAAGREALKTAQETVGLALDDYFNGDHRKAAALSGDLEKLFNFELDRIEKKDLFEQEVLKLKNINVEILAAKKAERAQRHWVLRVPTRVLQLPANYKCWLVAVAVIVTGAGARLMPPVQEAEHDLIAYNTLAERCGSNALLATINVPDGVEQCMEDIKIAEQRAVVVARMAQQEDAFTRYMRTFDASQIEDGLNSATPNGRYTENFYNTVYGVNRAVDFLVASGEISADDAARTVYQMVNKVAIETVAYGAESASGSSAEGRTQFINGTYDRFVPELNRLLGTNFERCSDGCAIERDGRRSEEVITLPHTGERVVVNEVVPIILAYLYQREWEARPLGAPLPSGSTAQTYGELLQEVRGMVIFAGTENEISAEAIIRYVLHNSPPGTEEYLLPAMDMFVRTQAMREDIARREAEINASLARGDEGTHINRRELEEERERLDALDSTLDPSIARANQLIGRFIARDPATLHGNELIYECGGNNLCTSASSIARNISRNMAPRAGFAAATAYVLSHNGRGNIALDSSGERPRITFTRIDPVVQPTAAPERPADDASANVPAALIFGQGGRR